MKCDWPTCDCPERDQCRHVEIIARLTMERDSAYQRGAEAMREACAVKCTSFLVGDPGAGIALRSPMPREISDAIRVLPLPQGPK